MALPSSSRPKRLSRGVDLVDRLVIATQNSGKLREFRQLLAGRPFQVVAAESMPDVEETGETYAANATLKARAVAAWANEWALADDSGLEVDALGGEPGLRSTRWAGPDSTEESRNKMLLARLADVPTERRTARYRAACVLAAPDGRLFVGEGVCEGVVLTAGRGERGFGYDPLFYLPERDRTMAELSAEEKNEISHRARALQALHSVFKALCGEIEAAP